MWNRIIGPTVMVVLFWLAFTAVVTIAMWWVARFHSSVVAETGITIQAANSMSDTLWNQVAFVLSAQPANASNIERDLAALDKQFDHHLDLAEETSYTTTEQGISRSIRQKYGDLKVKLRERLAAVRRRAVDLDHSNTQLLAAAGAIADLCRQLRTFNERLAAADVERQGRVITFIALAFVGILVIGTVGGVLWSVHTAAEVDTSVSQISISLGGADSPLTEELGSIGLNVSGNLNRLRKQVDVVADRIRQVVGDLQQERRKSIVASRLAVAGELAAGVAHEIRNPLTSVKLLLHAATAQTQDRSLSQRQLDVIQSEIARMEKIVQDLLDFARPPQVNPVRHDLRATVHGAVQLTAGSANHGNVAVHCRLPEQEVQVDADPAQLHQVFVNLLLNAIEAMPSGGTLDVSIEVNGSRGNDCRVVFADSGPGIPPHVIERIFEPFVSGKKNGTGLGLAVSRRLVQEQGGQLSAANGPAGGAVLTVDLPTACQANINHV